MAKYVNDVRSSSSDSRHMDVVFTGLMDDAIAQAKAAKDFPLPPLPHGAPRGMSRARASLLQFLNLLPKKPRYVVIKHARIPSLWFAEGGGFTKIRSKAKVLPIEQADRARDSLQVLGLGPFELPNAAKPKTYHNNVSTAAYAAERGWL
jgi:hypothetical protein